MNENRQSSTGGAAAPIPSWASPQRLLEYEATRFIPASHTVMTGAGEVAQHFGQLYVAPVHMLITLCHDTGIAALLGRLDVSNVDIYNAAVERAPRNPPAPDRTTAISPGVDRIIAFAHAERKARADEWLNPKDLLMGILRDEEGLACEILWEQWLTLDAVYFENPMLRRERPAD